MLALFFAVLGLLPLRLTAAAAAQSIATTGNVITPTHRVFLPVVVKPPPSMQVSSGHGFDTCAAPTASELATWKRATPYEYLGIYIGGVSHFGSCKSYNEQYQTPQWLAEVRAQGWQFIPTWVGPQAPCTTFNYRLSSDPITATLEGTLEAQQAITAATTLGLRHPLIIYYDMEYYFTGNTECHTAVKAFLDGWVGELHRQGHKAGIYSAGSAINSWYTLNNPPDSTWGAWWNNRRDFDPFMTVDLLNQNFVNPAYWDEHRLFQYSGSHNESWDGVKLLVDNNVANGLVALSGEPSPSLREAKLLSPATGWLWLDEQIYLTRDGGDSWQPITPPGSEAVLGLQFEDEWRGWLAGFEAAAGQPTLWRTGDGGRTWQSLPLPRIEQPIRAVHLDFVSDETGWLLAELESGLNFSQGRLFRTGDGGQSWVELNAPLGGPISFVNATTGWLAGGPTHSSLYRTGDGGQSWQPATISAGWGDALPAYRLPVFGDVAAGAIAVTVSRPGSSRVEIHTTGNGGDSWQPAETAPLPRPVGPGVIAPAQTLGPAEWVVGAASPDLPAHTTELSFATPQTGWAISRHNSCAATGCTRNTTLWRTRDGGASWAALSLP
ncbi:MAG: hypothetical protein Kow0031_17000 [Anaerolineae bacterium]